MKIRTLTVLDIRDEYVCDCCFVERLKRYFDDRYVSTKPEFELLIVTPEQATVMRRIARFSSLKASWISEDVPPGNIDIEVGIESWWGVPVSVQKR